MRARTGILGLLITAVVIFPTAANAICFDHVGCSNSKRFTDKELRKLNCGELWFVRNGIYDDNGYCFKTEQGISAFGNDKCSYDDVNAVPLNATERFNVGAIKKMEQAKGC
jgi:YARHG domain-containing protein